MTFIASVVAKDGVAVIADSLVTTSSYILPIAKWHKFLSNKKMGVQPGEDFKLTEEEITDLFIRKTVHTRDYENKLFEFDNHTIITTAGMAQLNKKRIGNIVLEIKNKMQAEGAPIHAVLDEKIKAFTDHLKIYVDEEFKLNGFVDDLVLIYTNYDTALHATHVYKIDVTVDEDENNVLFPVVNYLKQDDIVVCDGQSNIAYRILYGGLLDGLEWFSQTLEIFKSELEGLGIKEGEGSMPAGFYETFRSTKSNEMMKGRRAHVKLDKLRNLSLQQATDLSFLLLKVERDFQLYTEPIPTVGGQIKLAVINDKGIKYILGEEIIPPTLHL